MYLTSKILDRCQSCQEGKDWFAKHYPDGGELIDIIADTRVNEGFLFWGFEHLGISDTEREAYYKRLKIDCSDNRLIYCSSVVSDSSYVTNSHRVTDSKFVFDSKRVKESNSVLNSTLVERSQRIFNSNYVYDSDRVCASSNVTNSQNIMNSKYIVNSHSVVNADNVTNSSIIHSFRPNTIQGIDQCSFITDGKRLVHCLFCAELEDKELHLFNKPITEMQFNMIKQQLDSFIGDFQPAFGNPWEKEVVSPSMPKFVIKSEERYKGIDEEFWGWIKTLPGYDPVILYKITQDNRLIDEM